MLRALLNLGNGQGRSVLDLAVRRSHEPGVAHLSQALLGDATGSSVQAVAPRLVCLVSVARSGTNYLASLLSRISEVAVRHEIFNKSRCQTMHRDELAEFSRRSGQNFPLLCDHPEAVSALRRHPGIAVDCLADFMPPDKALLFFKVFRLQLLVHEVRKAIIERPDTIIVVLRRRPIDTFISLRKALHQQQWYGQDTTGLKISIDADDFIGWWGRTNAWFHDVEAACWTANKPLHRLQYEDDVNVPAANVIARFHEILAQHGMSKLTVLPEGEPSEIRRQDRNSELHDRVANWSEFAQCLRDKGFLEKAFAPFPAFEPTTWNRFKARCREVCKRQ